MSGHLSELVYGLWLGETKQEWATAVTLSDVEPSTACASRVSSEELLLSWEGAGTGWQSKWDLIRPPDSCEFFECWKNECLNNSISLKAQLFKIWEECSDDSITLTTTLVIVWFILQIWGKRQKFWAQHLLPSTRAIMENNTCNAKFPWLR